MVNVLTKVIKGNENYDARLISAVPIKKGSILTALSAEDIREKPSYQTLQLDRTKHLQINNDFVYMNHSCDPNLEVDTANMVVRAAKDIEAGQELSFFYPSCEWSMNQPFDCWCGAKKGAKYLEDLPSNLFINEHIRSLWNEENNKE